MEENVEKKMLNALRKLWNYVFFDKNYFVFPSFYHFPPQKAGPGLFPPFLCLLMSGLVC